jgi:hypothetical protein
MKKSPKKATAKKAAKAATKTPSKPARKAARKPGPARPAKSGAGTYTPPPIQGIGWAPFRYPIQ